MVRSAAGDGGTPLAGADMATHIFAVGQTLHFSPGLGGDSKRQGRYMVVRQVPETGGIFQYRIKSEMDGHERVVREDQVERRSHN